MRHGCFLPELSALSEHGCTRLKRVVCVSDIPGTFSKQPPTLRAAPAHAVASLGPHWPSTASADPWGSGSHSDPEGHSRAEHTLPSVMRV